MTPLLRTTPLKRGKNPRSKRLVKASERGVAIKVLDGGREVCTSSEAGRREYAQRRNAMAERQDQRCAVCGFPFNGWLGAATFDHQAGRTAERRDERIEVDGVWQNAAVHGKCNSEMGSRRYEWRGGKYQLRSKA